MNYEQANSIKELALEVMKVLEGLTVKGINPLTGDTLNVLWKWQPQVGEWYMCRSNLLLLPQETEHIRWFVENNYLTVQYRKTHLFAEELYPMDRITPILHWETIEAVLLKAGYSLIVDNISCNLYEMAKNKDGTCFIAPDNPLISATGKDRQEAVYQAVIALGKKLNAK